MLDFWRRERRSEDHRQGSSTWQFAAETASTCPQRCPQQQPPTLTWWGSLVRIQSRLPELVVESRTWRQRSSPFFFGGTKKVPKSRHGLCRCVRFMDRRTGMAFVRPEGWRCPLAGTRDDAEKWLQPAAVTPAAVLRARRRAASGPIPGPPRAERSQTFPRRRL
jgi:hypothetical protein